MIHCLMFNIKLIYATIHPLSNNKINHTSLIYYTPSKQKFQSPSSIYTHRCCSGVLDVNYAPLRPKIRIYAPSWNFFF